MNAAQEQKIRPGVSLFWGNNVFDSASFLTVAHAVFVFSVTDAPASVAANQMVFATKPSFTTSAKVHLANAFDVVVALSVEGFTELLATDQSVSARRLRQMAEGGSEGMLTLPFTAGVRFAVESIRRCPFAGICRDMALGARCNDLLVEFLTAVAAAETPSQTPLTRAVHDRIYAAAEALKCQLEEAPALSGLARGVGLSETTLKRGFHQIFGTTVFGYLRERRMEYARALLESGEATVLEAAARVGYSNPSNFAAAFRRQFGVNPKTFQLTARR